MATVKLELASQTSVELAQFATRVGLALQAHDDIFPATPVDGGDLRAAAAAFLATLQSVETARTKLREAQLVAQTARQEISGMLNAIGLYVQNRSGGNSNTIGLAALDIRNTPAAVGGLPAPGEFTLAETARPGQVLLRWKSIPGARGYLVEQTAALTPAPSWKAAVNTTKAKAMVNDVPPGAQRWFRVAAIGAAGQGNWSDTLGVATS
ncbi:MAG TPA: fibronectin type III domain-containing protein [Candidatus Dormibacteraeota bacterium]|nr:fibronectin type III domain-containing protein [Candidatus Dormibacteraeota bacterium]